jgi:MFS transporter, ACS family, tartrate transporter
VPATARLKRPGAAPFVSKGADFDFEFSCIEEQRLSEMAMELGGVMSAIQEVHTRRQIAIRLLPFLFFLYLINFLDRSSASYAAIGMARDLGFADRVFGFGFGIFFAGYLILQIPCAILVERWSARKVLAITLVAWGAMTSLTSLVHTPTQLYVARFLLGAAEAGFFPGVVIYLSHWFVREDRAKATSNFMAAIPLSFVVGSPIAGWVLSHSWNHLPGWRWLFIVEGLPAIFFGVLAYFLLTDRPHEATWLQSEQREWIASKLAQQKATQGRKMTVAEAFQSRNVLLLAVLTILNYTVFYAFIFWMPTMLKRMTGITDNRVGLLGAVPYLVCFVVMLANGWHSDKQMERRWHISIPMLVAAAGLFALMGAHSLWGVIGCLTLVTAGNAYLSVFWSLPTEILSPSIAAASVGLISSAGSIAGFLSPFGFGYLRETTGSFTLGLAILGTIAVAMAFAIFLVPKQEDLRKELA